MNHETSIYIYIIEDILHDWGELRNQKFYQWRLGKVTSRVDWLRVSWTEKRGSLEGSPIVILLPLLTGGRKRLPDKKKCLLLKSFKLYDLMNWENIVCSQSISFLQELRWWWWWGGCPVRGRMERAERLFNNLNQIFFNNSLICVWTIIFPV